MKKIWMLLALGVLFEIYKLYTQVDLFTFIRIIAFMVIILGVVRFYFFVLKNFRSPWL